jgi:hypothetical protein
MPPTSPGTLYIYGVVPVNVCSGPPRAARNRSNPLPDSIGDSASRASVSVSRMCGPASPSESWRAPISRQARGQTPSTSTVSRIVIELAPRRRSARHLRNSAERRDSAREGCGQRLPPRPTDETRPVPIPRGLRRGRAPPHRGSRAGGRKRHGDVGGGTLRG